MKDASARLAATRATERAPGKPLLEVVDLVKSFPIRTGIFQRRVGELRAVDGISLGVAHGETLGLVGESGCGKTTAGRAILRLVEPSAGSVRYRRTPESEPVELLSLGAGAMRRARRELQIIFQDPYASLNPRHGVARIIGEAIEVHGLCPRGEVEGRVIELLLRVGLPAEARHRFPHEFSGGQRQRIGIARALALEPRFIVCDEAVSALDLSIQAQIINLLRDLQQELGLSYLFIAHDLSVVKVLAARIAVMYLGRIVETGTAREIFESPAHPYTRALLAAIPRPDPRRRRAHVPLAGDVPSPIDPPSGCYFHPRCPLAEARCRESYPDVFALSPTQRAACHLLDGNAEVLPQERP